MKSQSLYLENQYKGTGGVLAGDIQHISLSAGRKLCLRCQQSECGFKRRKDYLRSLDQVISAFAEYHGLTRG